VANTDFESGDNGHGYGDYIFLVICAQPSHVAGFAVFEPKIQSKQPRPSKLPSKSVLAAGKMSS
jgi:hypothetical protein